MVASRGHCEVLIVDNASTDSTPRLARAFAEQHAYARLLREPRRGKGAAVRTGMLAATGDFRLVADADLSMPLSEIDKFLRALESADVAIGSREASGARRIGEPVSRHLAGRLFNTWVRLVILRGFADTQCGFKAFRAAAAQEIFARQRSDDWIFDIEILLLARDLGYRVAEVPIEWHYRERGKLSPLRAGPRMAWRALALRWNRARRAS
jgi:glycosyltransferase involved in cell wall biosynthesis